MTLKNVWNDDGSLTYWDVYRQQWRTEMPGDVSDEVLASMSQEERDSIEAAKVQEETDTYGWRGERHVECDKCHRETQCCRVDFNDGSGDWDYCKACWQKLSENGDLDGHWV